LSSYRESQDYVQGSPFTALRDKTDEPIAKKYVDGAVKHPKNDALATDCPETRVSRATNRTSL